MRVLTRRRRRRRRARAVSRAVRTSHTLSHKDGYRSSNAPATHTHAWPHVYTYTLADIIGRLCRATRTHTVTHAEPRYACAPGRRTRQAFCSVKSNDPAVSTAGDIPFAKRTPFWTCAWDAQISSGYRCLPSDRLSAATVRSLQIFVSKEFNYIYYYWVGN